MCAKNVTYYHSVQLHWIKQGHKRFPKTHQSALTQGGSSTDIISESLHTEEDYTIHKTTIHPVYTSTNEQA